MEELLLTSLVMNMLRTPKWVLIPLILLKFGYKKKLTNFLMSLSEHGGIILSKLIMNMLRTPKMGSHPKILCNKKRDQSN